MKANGAALIPTSTWSRAILALFVVLLVSILCLGQTSIRPLPQQIFSGEAVFLDGGTSDLLDVAAQELSKWGRFKVVATIGEADLIFRFGLDWKPGQVAIENLAIIDAKTGEDLYYGDREGHFAPWSQLTRSLIQDLRNRMEGEKVARTIEYTMQFGSRAASFFTDAAAFNDQLAAIPPSSDSSKALRDSSKAQAAKFRTFASQLTRWNSETAKTLPKLKANDFGRQRNAEAIEKYLDEILLYTCHNVKLEEELDRLLRPYLSPEAVQKLDAVKTSAAALQPDCSSERAVSLLNEQAKH